MADKIGLMHSLEPELFRRLLEESCLLCHVRGCFLSLGVGGNVSEVFLWFLDGVDQYVQTS